MNKRNQKKYNRRMLENKYTLLSLKLNEADKLFFDNMKARSGSSTMAYMMLSMCKDLGSFVNSGAYSTMKMIHSTMGSGTMSALKSLGIEG